MAGGSVDLDGREQAAGGGASDALVRALGISKVYGSGAIAATALKPCDLELRRGEMVAIMGPSGSGKSTLLHLLSGLDAPSTGDVQIGGSSLKGMGESELARLRARAIGFILQRDNLVPTLRLEENVAAPLMLSGHGRAEGLAVAARWLERVGLQHRRRAFPGEVSGGEAQRAAVARACCVEPALIVADEPTGALDTANAKVVIELLAELTSSLGTATVLATHDHDIAAKAHRQVHIVDGELTLARP